MDKENEKKKENERNKCEDSSTSGEAITETVVIEQPIRTSSGRILFTFESEVDKNPSVGDLRRALKRKR